MNLRGSNTMLWISDANIMSIAQGDQKNTAFFKAKSDYAKYIQEIGAKTLNIYSYFWADEPEEMLNGRIDGMLAGFHNGDVLVLQIPTYIRTLNVQVLIQRIQNVYHGKVIGVIHDYDPIYDPEYAKTRSKLGDPLHRIFAYDTYDIITPQCDALIVHSERFKKVLQERLNYTKPIITQGPFGYIGLENSVNEKRHLRKSIIFAGALSKAQYLKDIPVEWNMDVFGPEMGNNYKYQNNVSYRGSFTPEELPNHLSDGFGLVWASDSFSEISGKDAEYTRLNYSHKLSLYLFARLPIIVWSQSAPAEWVVKNGVGIAVDSLAEVWNKIESVTEEEFQIMQSNLDRISPLIRDGIYSKIAVLKAYEEVSTDVNARF